MRDYKNVRVPKGHRPISRRTTVVRRTTTSGRGASQVRRPAGRIGIIFLLAAIAAGSYMGWLGYRWFAESETFQIKAVEIHGVRRLSANDFRIFEEAFAGRNIFLVDLNSVAAQAAMHPWVKDIRIYRRLPNKISVRITEREAAAVIVTPTGNYLIDGTGAVMERLGKQQPSGLPVITVGRINLSIGEVIEAGPVKDALSLLYELSQRGGWSMSDVRIKAETPEAITVLYANREFRMGSGNYPEKLRRLSEIAADMNRRGLDFAYIDLRPERQAAVMIR